MLVMSYFGNKGENPFLLVMLQPEENKFSVVFFIVQVSTPGKKQSSRAEFNSKKDVWKTAEKQFQQFIIC